MSEPMSDEDRAYMQQQTGHKTAEWQASRWDSRPHEERVRVLLGWITLFTGIVAAATVANFIAGIIIGASGSTPGL